MVLTWHTGLDLLFHDPMKIFISLNIFYKYRYVIIYNYYILKKICIMFKEYVEITYAQKFNVFAAEKICFA